MLFVNDEEITVEDIKNEIERLKPHYEQYVKENNSEGSDQQLKEWARENVIERSLLKQEALKASEKIAQTEINAEYNKIKDNNNDISKEELKKEIEIQLRLDSLINKIYEKADAPSDDEIKDFYDKNKDQFIAPEMVRVSHIVKHVDAVHDKNSAKMVIRKMKQELDEGISFEELAIKYSDCPDRAGDLGYFPRGQMVQEFEDVVFSMEINEVSDIFITDFGYHIAKLYDKVPSRPIPINEVKDRIIKELAEAKKSDVLENYIDELKSKATIEDK